MRISSKWLLPIIALGLPVAAFAQSSDAQYCSALSAKYEKYLDMNSRTGRQPQSLDAKVAVEKCKAGDSASAIPVLEKALNDAKIELPPRT